MNCLIKWTVFAYPHSLAISCTDIDVFFSRYSACSSMKKISSSVNAHSLLLLLCCCTILKKKMPYSAIDRIRHKVYLGFGLDDKSERVHIKLMCGFLSIILPKDVRHGLCEHALRVTLDLLMRYIIDKFS